MQRLALSLSLLCALGVLGSQAFAQPAQPPAAAPAAPAAAPAPPPPFGTPITNDQAKKAAAAAIAEATKMNIAVAIAIFEPSGDLVYFERMDNTQYGSLTVAQQKGRSAALFCRPTKSFADRVAQHDLGPLALAGANWSDGGLPIIVGGKMIGAIGCSGGAGPQDGQVSKAGTDALM